MNVSDVVQAKMLIDEIIYSGFSHVAFSHADFLAHSLMYHLVLISQVCYSLTDVMLVLTTNKTHYIITM